MDSLIIELLFFFLLFVSAGAYIIGKNKQWEILRALGVRSAATMIVMMIVYTWITWKRD